MSAAIEGPSVRRAVWMKQQAAEGRVFAKQREGTAAATAMRERADLLESQAAIVFDPASHFEGPVSVAGGEISTTTADCSIFVDTLVKLDMVGVDASRQRLSLASSAGILALALDAVETAEAGNSLEKMLAHQVAAAHAAAMELQADAMELLRQTKAQYYRYATFDRTAARLLNASARMMEATQRGISTLARLRTVGKQTLIVQHVHVGDGGRAVVAGQVKGRRRRQPQTDRDPG